MRVSTFIALFLLLMSFIVIAFIATLSTRTQVNIGPNVNGSILILASVTALLSMTFLVMRVIESNNPRSGLRFASFLLRFAGMLILVSMVIILLLGIVITLAALVIPPSFFYQNSTLNTFNLVSALPGAAGISLVSLGAFLAYGSVGAAIYGFGALLAAIARIEEDQRTTGQIILSGRRRSVITALPPSQGGP